VKRLLVLVEGETEETFVKELLRPHLGGFGFADTSARLMGNARMRSRRGGIRGWPEVKKEIIRHILEDYERYVTTFVDYYGLPASGEKAWPGRNPHHLARYSPSLSALLQLVISP